MNELILLQMKFVARTKFARILHRWGAYVCAMR